ncbi:hypothetical protein DSUL_20580 [Desulfovibrionales bacterium]
MLFLPGWLDKDGLDLGESPGPQVTVSVGMCGRQISLSIGLTIL